MLVAVFLVFVFVFLVGLVAGVLADTQGGTSPTFGHVAALRPGQRSRGARWVGRMGGWPERQDGWGMRESGNAMLFA